MQKQLAGEIKTNDIFTLERLYSAYIACRKHKRNTVNGLRFEIRMLDNLVGLRDELASRSYHPSTSICFVHKKPKLREIFAADFRDRVVHHLLVGYLEPLFERIFIHDSYACRKNKGIHSGIKRLTGHLNKVTANGTRRAWYLKEDISGFFMNLDKELLYKLVCKRVKRQDIRWLAKTLIFHDCTDDYQIKGNADLLQKIPPHKSLFKVPAGKGLPIGNLTSQFFANVYLNELDQFVKHHLRCRWYIRYCDDFLLLSTDPDQLADWHQKIEEFLRRKLLLELNPSQYRLRQVSSGIDFLGYIVRRRYVLVRRRVVNHFREKLDGFEKKISIKQRGRVVAWKYPTDTVEQLRAVTSSYLGHFSWANSCRLTIRLFEKHAVLRACFMIGSSSPLRIEPRYQLARAVKKGFHYEYRWWVVPAPWHIQLNGGSYTPQFPLWVGWKHKKNILVFFPVGTFYEFYDSQAELAHLALGLKLIAGMRGFKSGCGFHRRMLGNYLAKAKDLGFHVALLGNGYNNGSLNCSRRLVRLFAGKKGE